MKLARATDGKVVLRLRTGLSLKLGNLWAGFFLLAGIVILAGFSIGIGTTDIGLGGLLGALRGRELEGYQNYALWDVRLPRILAGFMVGWLVATAGAMLQSMARNPLADPGLFGLSQGSMVMIMLLLVLAPTAAKGWIPVAALIGGMGVAFLMLLLMGRGQMDGLAVLLAGIALETVLSSVGSILILYTPREMSYALASWMAGSLFQATWEGIGALMPWFLLSLPGVFLLGSLPTSRDMDVEVAMALGEPAKWSRPAMLFFTVLLSSAAVTMAGPLMFLGVLAPLLANFISPATGRARLILSGTTGAILVVGADSLSRSFTDEIALPIGLSLMIIGVPLFILCLRLRAIRSFLG